MARYRKKPVEVEAVFFDAYTSALGPAPWNDGGHIWKWLIEGGADFEMRQEDPGPAYMLIHTLEGVMRADVGDYIIRGVKGEFYPCKPDIFEATYESVGPSQEEVIARAVRGED
jgi:hypothetical protein